MKKLVLMLAVAFSATLFSCGGNKAAEEAAVEEVAVEEVAVEEVAPVEEATDTTVVTEEAPAETPAEPAA